MQIQKIVFYRDTLAHWHAVVLRRNVAIVVATRPHCLGLQHRFLLATGYLEPARIAFAVRRVGVVVFLQNGFELELRIEPPGGGALDRLCH